MIQAAPSVLTSTLISSQAGPPDGAGALGTDNAFPQPAKVTREEVMHGLNPLQHLPVIGMIYRAATGEQIPTTMRVAGAGIVGGPLGMIGAAFMCLFEELIRMGPDTSRPPTPVGMAQTGSESGMDAVTPGTAGSGAYTTLATMQPDFLQSTPDILLAQRGTAAYQSASTEFDRSQAWEKGLT